MSSIQLWEDFQSIHNAFGSLVAAPVLKMPWLGLWPVGDLPRPTELLGVPSEQPFETVSRSVGDIYREPEPVDTRPGA